MIEQSGALESILNPMLALPCELWVTLESLRILSKPQRPYSKKATP